MGRHCWFSLLHSSHQKGAGNENWMRSRSNDCLRLTNRGASTHKLSQHTCPRYGFRASLPTTMVSPVNAGSAGVGLVSCVEIGSAHYFSACVHYQLSHASLAHISNYSTLHWSLIKHKKSTPAPLLCLSCCRSHCSPPLLTCWPQRKALVTVCADMWRERVMQCMYVCVLQ